MPVMFYHISVILQLNFKLVNNRKQNFLMMQKYTFHPIFANIHARIFFVAWKFYV